MLDANAHRMKPFSAGCDFPPTTTRAFTALQSLRVHPYISLSEGIVNMNRPQFDRGVLCLSFGASLTLIQLSKYENQGKIQAAALFKWP